VCKKEGYLLSQFDSVSLNKKNKILKRNEHDPRLTCNGWGKYYESKNEQVACFTDSGNGTTDFF
jgi:hypothetical protein